MPASRALPRKPSAKPAPIRQVSAVLPPGTMASKNAAHSGIAATKTLATPDAMNCSDQTRMALAPTSRKPDAGEGDDAPEQQSRQQKPHSREQERRQVGDADPDGQVRRAPNRAHQQVGDERLAAQRRHVSPAPRAPRPVSRRRRRARWWSGYWPRGPARAACEGFARAPRARARPP